MAKAEQHLPVVPWVLAKTYNVRSVPSRLKNTAPSPKTFVAMVSFHKVMKNVRTTLTVRMTSTVVAVPVSVVAEMV